MTLIPSSLIDFTVYSISGGSSQLSTEMKQKETSIRLINQSVPGQLIQIKNVANLNQDDNRNETVPKTCAVLQCTSNVGNCPFA